jgi:hypothetical protein
LSRASVGDQHSATWGLQFSKTFEIFKKLKILKKTQNRPKLVISSGLGVGKRERELGLDPPTWGKFLQFSKSFKNF